MNKWISFASLLLLAIAITACTGDQSGQDAEPQSAISQQTEDSGSEVSGKQAEPAAEAVLSGEVVIEDIASWEHPVKPILAPYELYKVVLTKESTYPAFYVRSLDEQAIKSDPAAMGELLRKTAAANGYWDYELVNEQDVTVVKVRCDKAAKKVIGVTVNGDNYDIEPAASAAEAADTAQSDGDLTRDEAVGNGQASGGSMSHTAIKLPRKYAEYMKTQGKTEEDIVVFYDTADLNGDGAVEAIVAYRYDYASEEDMAVGEVYVLRERNGKIEHVGETPYSPGGYAAYKIELVRLQDREEPVIQLHLSNGGGMAGFELLALKNDTIKSLCYAASATGAGEDTLVDADHDGRYDGYISDRWSYEVLYYGVHLTYELRDGEFQLTAADVGIDEYPQAIRDVVAQYVELRVIDGYAEGMSSALTKRLNELCPNCEDRNRDVLNNEALNEAVHSTLGDRDSDYVKYAVEQKKTSATVVMSYSGDGDKKARKIQFQLVRKNGKWTITGIK